MTDYMTRSARSGKAKCSRVVFIWSIRDISAYDAILGVSHLTGGPVGHVRWISDTLSKAMRLTPQSLSIDIRISVTGSSLETLSQSFDDDSIHSGQDQDEKDKQPPSILKFPSVNVTAGRPNIQAMLQEEVDTTTGRMSVSGMFPLTIY